jgi:hypothetical protein
MISIPTTHDFVECRVDPLVTFRLSSIKPRRNT